MLTFQTWSRQGIRHAPQPAHETTEESKTVATLLCIISAFWAMTQHECRLHLSLWFKCPALQDVDSCLEEPIGNSTHFIGLFHDNALSWVFWTVTMALTRNTHTLLVTHSIQLCTISISTNHTLSTFALKLELELFKVVIKSLKWTHFLRSNVGQL